jgi:hypothetical protein
MKKKFPEGQQFEASEGNYFSVGGFINFGEILRPCGGLALAERG